MCCTIKDYYCTLQCNKNNEQMPAITLKDIPDDIYAEILRVQTKEMAEKKKQFSKESAVYKIIKSTIETKSKKQ